MNSSITPKELRMRIRKGEHTGNTSGYCQGFVQCNVVILPEDWAFEFMRFCHLNPKPCPLIGVSDMPGSKALPSLGEDIDICRDIPSYRVYVNGELVDSVPDVSDFWRDDLIAFAIGCSFSFEEALISNGLEIRNISEGKNVPMYRTSIQTTPVGRFHGSMVCSMRPFVAADAIRAVQICSRFPSVHGAPVHIGNPDLIGIADLAKPDYGDPVQVREGEEPVFWACGVTPQAVVEQSKPPFCIAQGPGDMLVTDIKNNKFSVI